ncbi:MAG: NAD-dependent epimerase/dehydratase family protein [Actinobacteria bacterium]|nr:NAD-dependent epimerase/dehydratase family protein [Actinomycetota bacterium]
MNILMTGGAGFLGARLARELLAAGSIAVDGQAAQPIGQLTLVDRAPLPPDLAAHPTVRGIEGDLLDLLLPGGQGLDAMVAADVIFHLAAAVSGECETDFDLGLRANVQATEALLAVVRSAQTYPLVVFASSAAAFGDSPDHPLPEVVDDQTAPNPQTSYGAQKVICEQLVADYTRKGFLRGRVVRLMTVSIRPGRPNAAASGFMSGIIREPLAGQRAICPVTPDTGVVLSSPANTIRGLLRAASAGEAAWGGRSPVNLPALNVTIGEMVQALEQVAGPETTALIDWQPDPAIERIVSTWPAHLRADRAARLGLAPDPDFRSIIEQHLAETR